MVAFGLILVVLSGLLAAGVLLSNTDPVVASAFGVSLSNVSLGGFFLLGAGVGLVLALGLAVTAAGARRRRAKRRGLKDAVKAERSERESLEEQNARLRDQLQPGGRGDAVTDGADLTDATGTDNHRHARDEQRAEEFPR